MAKRTATQGSVLHRNCQGLAGISRTHDATPRRAWPPATQAEWLPGPSLILVHQTFHEPLHSIRLGRASASRLGSDSPQRIIPQAVAACYSAGKMAVRRSQMLRRNSCRVSE